MDVTVCADSHAALKSRQIIQTRNARILLLGHEPRIRDTSGTLPPSFVRRLARRWTHFRSHQLLRFFGWGSAKMARLGRRNRSIMASVSRNRARTLAIEKTNLK